MSRTYKRWTQEEDCRLAALYPHRDRHELATIFQCSSKAITSQIYVLGLLKKDSRLASERYIKRAGRRALTQEERTRRIASGIVTTSGNITIHRMQE